MLKLLINLEFLYFYQKEYSKKNKTKKYRKMGLLASKMQISNDATII
jgi:hypothetical protein